MTDLLRVTLLYALVPVVFTMVGATAGAFWPPFRRARGHVLHLAAGVVFSVVAVELLPEIQRRALVQEVVIGFALGIATMLVVDRVLDRIRDDDGAGDAGDAVDGEAEGAADPPRPAPRIGVHRAAAASA